MNKPASIQVIDRAATLLDTIAQSEGPVSLKVLSAETGLHPSTAFRILGSLGEVGFVERDSAGHYQLGRKLLKLAGRVRRGIDIREEARDIMRELRDQVGETVNLTVREGDEVIYVERISARRMMRVEQVVGSRAPLHVTAVGKLMLGELGDEFVRAYADRTGLLAFTPHTITSIGKLLHEVHAVSVEHFAFDNQEAEEGVGCIGSLIYDNSGKVVGGLSISAPIERRSDAWIPLVQDAARRISERLGYFAGRT
ncbi:MAG: IclR family transcriptional regulator [Chromatiales bacterium]|jgi:DNA-binding IclR family transcriptional regulator